MSLAKELSIVQKKINHAIDRMLAEDRDPSILYNATRHLISAGGKRLRPFLTLKSCEIVGGKEGDALPSAIAIELLHNFTLIHDDIMDDSKKRRGVPTVHALWGVPIAIDAGDMLFAKVYETILSHTPRYIPHSRILQVLSSITDSTMAICKGQAYDILFEKRKTVTEKEYFEMIRWKTATLYGTAAKVGAIIGGGTMDQIARLHAYGFNIGIAFQIKDDILGLVGDEPVLRKPVGDDIKRGKRTILVAYALRHCTGPQRSKILAALGNPNATPKQLHEATEAIRTVGALEHSEKKALAFVNKAKMKLDPFPNTHTKKTLLELADFIVKREF